MKLKIKKLCEGAILPRKAHADDAGIDLFACIQSPSKQVVIPSHSRAVIGTGIAMEIPKGWFGLIKDRSGLAAKYGLHVLAGVVDAGYRGEVKVVLYNTSNEPFVVKHGMKIAQMLILPVPEIKIEEVEELTDSERGENGFGSTGV